MEAQQATDSYNLTHQKNLYETALLTLKQKMNFPAEDTLQLDTAVLDTQTLQYIQLTQERADDVFRIALNVNPTLQQAALNAKVADMRRKIWYRPSRCSVESPVLIIRNFILRLILISVPSSIITSVPTWASA